MQTAAQPEESGASHPKTHKPLLNPEAMKELRERRGGLEGAKAAGAPVDKKEKGPAITDETEEAKVECSPPQPHYVPRALPNGDLGFVPDNMSILVKGVGVVPVMDVMRKPTEEELAAIRDAMYPSDMQMKPSESKAMAKSLEAPAPPSSSGSVSGKNAYTTIDGRHYDIGDGFLADRLEDLGELARDTMQDQLGKQVTEAVEDAVVSAGKSQGFFKRRVEKEEKANQKISDFEEAVINHPGIKQPVEGTAAFGKFLGRIALETKPDKVSCTLM